MMLEERMAAGQIVANTWYEKDHSKEVTYRGPGASRERLPRGQGAMGPGQISRAGSVHSGAQMEIKFKTWNPT